MMSAAKPKVAFFDFSSCEGCQLTVIDSLQTHPDLLDAVEIVQFREAMSERGEDYLVAFVEGSCSRKSDESRLQKIRDQAKILVALGACAHIGGINAIRNSQPLDEVRKYVYRDRAEVYEADLARPIGDVVQVDAIIPGCPIDREEFTRAVKNLLLGKMPNIPDYPVCMECKLKENNCLYFRGKTCLGPITRAGCGAICPSFGNSCEGCRGLISHPNIPYMREVMAEHGIDDAMITAKLGLFLSDEVMKSEVGTNGK